MYSAENLSPAQARIPDRRLFAVKVFVAVAIVAAIALIVLAVNHHTPAVAATKVAQAPVIELEPRVNEFVTDDRYVLEVRVPGVRPVVRRGFDPMTRRSTITLSWTPPSTMDDQRRCTRLEWRTNGFARVIDIPDGLGKSEVTLKDGVLTISFPLHATYGETLLIPENSRP